MQWYQYIKISGNNILKALILCLKKWPSTLQPRSNLLVGIIHSLSVSVNKFNKPNKSIVVYLDRSIFPINNQLLKMVFRNVHWMIFQSLFHSGISYKMVSLDITFVLPPSIIYATKYCFLSIVRNNEFFLRNY